MAEKRVSRKLKAQIADRAGGVCEYCQIPLDFSPDPWSVEHILPRARGGADREENLAVSCQGCNSHKQTQTSGHDRDTGEDTALYNPRTQAWEDHFAWSDDGTRIRGLTPCGRVTIQLLRLNRENLVNLRRVLRIAGVLPHLPTSS